MHKADIKALIEKKGATLSGVDRLYKLKEGSCRDALRRKRPYAELAISDYLQLPLDKIFPDRYSPEGMQLDEGQDHERG